MAEETAKGGVPAAVRQLLQEHAREGVALPASVAPAAPAERETAEPEAVEQLSLDELRDAFQRGYFKLLLEPKVMDAVRRHLRSRDKKACPDLLGVILSALLPHGKAGSGGGGSKIVFISKIDRSGVNTAAAKIETPG